MDRPLSSRATRSGDDIKHALAPATSNDKAPDHEDHDLRLGCFGTA
jgi:hypothetical protein